MTTRVTIYAGHGWPVDVAALTGKPGANEMRAQTSKTRVAPGETREFIVYDGQDLLIHEVQPNEVGAEAK